MKNSRERGLYLGCFELSSMYSGRTFISPYREEGEGEGSRGGEVKGVPSLLQTLGKLKGRSRRRKGPSLKRREEGFL